MVIKYECKEEGNIKLNITILMSSPSLTMSITKPTYKTAKYLKYN
jgi:hypothetical protein